MTDRLPPRGSAPPDPSDGEVLSAYLSGDLDEAAAAALEERLAGDPELTRRLDGTARVLAALRGVDEVDLPPDAGRRLRDRLAAGPDPVGDATVRPLDVRRRRPWKAVAGVAAGLAALALVGGGLLQGLGTRGVEMARDDSTAGEQAEERAVPEAMEAPAAGDAAEDEDGEVFTGRDRLDDEEAAVPPAPAAPPSPADGPVILDEEAALPGAAAVRARYRDLAEVTGLLGEPVSAAGDRAAAYRAAVAEASAFRSGARPGDCLAQTGHGNPVIPVRVESVVHEGRPALAYVLVSADDDSPTLDRAEAWIVDVSGCAPRLVLDVA